MKNWKPWKHDNESAHARPFYQTQIELDNLKLQNEELLMIASELAYQLKVATDPFFIDDGFKEEGGCHPCNALARYSSFLEVIGRD